MIYTIDEWKELLQQITGGGRALENYDEYKKVEIDEKGIYQYKKPAYCHAASHADRNYCKRCNDESKDDERRLYWHD